MCDALDVCASGPSACMRTNMLLSAYVRAVGDVGAVRRGYMGSPALRFERAPTDPRAAFSGAQLRPITDTKPDSSRLSHTRRRISHKSRSPRALGVKRVRALTYSLSMNATRQNISVRSASIEALVLAERIARRNLERALAGGDTRARGRASRRYAQAVDLVAARRVGAYVIVGACNG